MVWNHFLRAGDRCASWAPHSARPTLTSPGGFTDIQRKVTTRQRRPGGFHTANKERDFYSRNSQMKQVLLSICTAFRGLQIHDRNKGRAQELSTTQEVLLKQCRVTALRIWVCFVCVCVCSGVVGEGAWVAQSASNS